MNYTQCVHRICLRPVTPQCRIDDLAFNNFEIFQKDPWLGHPSLFDESLLSLLKPPNTVVATENMTQDPPPVNVYIRFPIARAPVPVALAAVPVHFPPFALTAALVAPDIADVEAPEPKVLEPPYFPTQDVQFSDSSDDSSTNDAFLHARTLRDTSYLSSKSVS